MRVAKTKVLISCAVIAQLICAFIFAYIYMQKGRFLMMRLISYYPSSERDLRVCAADLHMSW